MKMVTFYGNEKRKKKTFTFERESVSLVMNFECIQILIYAQKSECFN